MTICIVDTSILVELLAVPGMTGRHDALVQEYEGRQAAGEQFLLPLPVLFETGNHIAHAPDGHARRGCAERFVRLARDALAERSPFLPTPFPDDLELASWLADFPDRAMAGVGLVDRALIALWDTQRLLHRGRRVLIWSLDDHLRGRDTLGP